MFICWVLGHPRKERGSTAPSDEGRSFAQETTLKSFSRGVVLGAAVVLAGDVHEPRAADRVYWANAGGAVSKISFANLDGTGGGDLNTSGAALACCPQGAAIDAAGGRIYWGNDGAQKISFANLDGSGGGDLVTSGATVDAPYSVAIDTGTGRVFWANYGANKISFARVDGSGGADLPISGTTPDGPQGITVDPVTGKVYWANNSGNSIAFANLDGSGGGTVNTAGAPVSEPRGIAVDAAAGKVYWANSSANSIGFARLDGSGGGTFNTTGATVVYPYGIAIDAVAGRLYWPNYNADKISSALLDGSGGADLPTIGAAVSAPNAMGLLHVPAGAGLPTITGGAAPGSVLECSSGAWEADVVGAFFFRAPRRFTYQWTRDGADLPGATEPSITTGALGDYRCRVKAENQAGTASQTSAGIPAPVVTGFDVDPDVMRVAKEPTPAVVPKGGRFVFTLSTAAAVDITIERQRTRKRFQSRGTLHRDGRPSDNTVTFTGRIGTKALPPGRYRATMTATNAAGASAPQVATFRIVRRGG
jgi:hypothetical protein